ncbi:uncharacterized protein LOC121382528 isoform X2 [Gigantopelta aegis]|uniref:uncharacterized protein LOC121382528 isoform X2 n=1 Tax=Gigantopelta aegis TaxID=1735272 RepID=UPI001B88C09E|nr:uncharacterized protein LOC121382528 isoform X2 [Gigantopelta aegis]
MEVLSERETTDESSLYENHTDSSLHETDTKSEMQNETELDTEPKSMHKELKAAHDALHLTQSRFHDYQVKTNLIVTSLKAQLYKKEHELRWQREHHERQAKKIVSHLLFLEGQLRKDQKQILELLQEKEKLIKQQKFEIDSLTTANLKLLTALKEFHIPLGSNGVHENRLIQDDFSLKQRSVSEFDRNRAHKKKFTEMRERLRRHRSSFELHNPEPLETLEEGAFRYGSQDNLSDSKELSIDILKERRMSMPCQKERPRSLTDFPPKITEYPLLELHKECDLKIEDLDLEDEEVDKAEDEIFENGDCEQSCLTKSNTVPQELSQIVVNGQNRNNSKKQRPLSESGLGLIPLEKGSKSPNKTSPQGHSPGETNPFKSIKTMLRRKGSKLKNKKRSVSLPQGANQEYYEALKKHFDKYDLS